MRVLWPLMVILKIKKIWFYEGLSNSHTVIYYRRKNWNDLQWHRKWIFRIVYDNKFNLSHYLTKNGDRWSVTDNLRLNFDWNFFRPGNPVENNAVMSVLSLVWFDLYEQVITISEYIAWKWSNKSSNLALFPSQNILFQHLDAKIIQNFVFKFWRKEIRKDPKSWISSYLINFLENI